MAIKNIKKYNSGYTLVETLFYTIIFAILSVALLNLMITMASSFMQTMVNGDIVQSGSITENISRELKQANNFSFSTNTLIVNTEDDAGNPKTVTYTLLNYNLQVADSVLGNFGNLNSPNISVLSFNIATINTLKGKAAKINLTIKSNRDSQNNMKDFQNTVILRGSY